MRWGRSKEPSEKSCVFSCLLVLSPFVFCVISLARNGRKTAIYHFVSSQIQKDIFAFCVITFEPIEVQTHSAPQNGHLNLSFVKDIYVDGRKLVKNGHFGGWVGAVTNKAELQHVGIFFCTQYPSLGFFINNKVGNQKN